MLKERIHFIFLIIVFTIAALAGGGIVGWRALNSPQAHAQSQAQTPVRVAQGNAPDQAVMSWDAVPGARYYRVGWVNMDDYRAIAGVAGREWLDTFAFHDLQNRGQNRHTIKGLESDTEYAFILGHTADRFGGAAGWSAWHYLTTPTVSCPATTPEPTQTPAPVPMPAAGQRPTPTPVPATSGNIATDRAALTAVYHATGGANWKRNDNWLTHFPLRLWWGVETDSNGRVTSLSIQNNNAAGHVPAEIYALNKLERLVIVDNDQLTGALTADIARFPNLKELALTGMTGSIPPDIEELRNLTYLELSRNFFTDGIPPAIGKLVNLQVMTANWNELTGPIPPEIGNMTSLTGLFLEGNNLSGAIPKQVGQLRHLKQLYLWENHLSGAIPPELGNLTKLEQLLLSDNDLSGSIPPELANIPNLKWLMVSRNNLTGCIPSGLHNVHDNDLDHIGLPWCE